MASPFVLALEKQLAGVGEQLLSVTPTGGFAAFLSSNPYAAAGYLLLAQFAHDELSKVEKQ